jgi:hypothetical protein
MEKKRRSTYRLFGIPTKLDKFLEKGREFLERSDNSRYRSLGDSGAAVLQGRDELCSATTENRLRPVAILEQ